MSHFVCQGFSIVPHGEAKLVERRTVGIAFDVVRELSCQSVETFAPQEMVLESNRPPGVVEPRRDKTGRGLAVSKELRGVCESNIRSHRPSSLSSRSTISGSLSLSALTLEVSLVNEIRYAHCVTQ